jgi:hypothetical protein
MVNGKALVMGLRCHWLSNRVLTHEPAATVDQSQECAMPENKPQDGAESSENLTDTEGELVTASDDPIDPPDEPKNPVPPRPPGSET